MVERFVALYLFGVLSSEREITSRWKQRREIYMQIAQTYAGFERSGNQSAQLVGCDQDVTATAAIVL